MVGASEKTTHEYHQTVLRLAHEFSGTEIAWNVSQHVLDTVWKSGAAAANSTPSSSSSERTTCIAHSCQACGFQLHPGWKGTSLRVKRPKALSSVAARKTQRRRALRKRKQAALAKHQKPKDYHHNRHHNRHRRNAGASTNSSSSNNSSSNRLYLLCDDVGIGPLDRNHLVLTCGRCGDKTCLKGLKREPPIQWKKAPPTVPSASKPSSGGVDNLSGNFERLPSLSKTTKQSVPPPQQSLRGAPKTTLLEQQLGKKYKKKKKPASKKKSGNLMNFLSSLNDDH